MVGLAEFFFHVPLPEVERKQWMCHTVGINFIRAIQKVLVNVGPTNGRSMQVYMGLTGLQRVLIGTGLSHPRLWFWLSPVRQNYLGWVLKAAISILCSLS
eukprot:TRINITY_DN30632_c0_g1_i1.p1 TRINITY_DN30632_c0_g1~~TRINITY_DN30632_c0_g1_i1.p1  ORF type:complete len:100 (+),score=15.33 TRINITY_DN30632_c0_g1_i1:411-710(+)